jgi:hypothetical protein
MEKKDHAKLQSACPVGLGIRTISDCHARLARSDFAGAAECYVGSQGPEAAFGYALSKGILWSSDERLQKLLYDLGEPRWTLAEHVFGEQGWLARTRHAWQGEARLTVLDQALEFPRAHTTWHNGLLVELNGPSGGGSIFITTQVLAPVDLPYLLPPVFRPEKQGFYVAAQNGPHHAWFAVAGTLHIEQFDVKGGGKIALTGDLEVVDVPEGSAPPFDKLPRVKAHLQFADDVSACERSLPGPLQKVRASDGQQAKLDELARNMKEGTSLAGAVRALVGTLPGLEQVAACFDQAADTRTLAFPLPASLHVAGRDLIARVPDSHFGAAMARLMAGAVEFVSAYDNDITLSGLLREGHVDLQGLTDRLNDHFLRLQEPAALARSQAQFRRALDSFGQGVDALGGPLPVTSYGLTDPGALTPAGMSLLQQLARAGIAAVNGEATLPASVPPLVVALGSVFGSAPLDRARSQSYPFDRGADGIGLVEAFFRDLARGRTRPGLPDSGVRFQPAKPLSTRRLLNPAGDFDVLTMRPGCLE